MREGDLVKLDILLAGDKVDALSMVVHRDKAYYAGPSGIAERLRKQIRASSSRWRSRRRSGRRSSPASPSSRCAKTSSPSATAATSPASASSSSGRRRKEEAHEAGGPHRGSQGGLPRRARAVGRGQRQEVIVLVHAGICDASMWDDFDLPGAERREVRGFGNTPLPESGEGLGRRRSRGSPERRPGRARRGLVRRPGLPRGRGPAAELVVSSSCWPRVPDHEWSDEIVLFAERGGPAPRGGRSQRRGRPERPLLGAVGGGPSARFPGNGSGAARLRDPGRRAGDDAGRDAPALARAAGGDRRACAGLSWALTSLPTPLLSRRHTSSTSPPARRAESSALSSRRKFPKCISTSPTIGS